MLGDEREAELRKEIREERAAETTTCQAYQGGAWSCMLEHGPSICSGQTSCRL